MPFEWRAVRNITLGINYRNLVASVTSRDGEAQDCLNVIPREDGSLSKIFGWLRRNSTALNGVPLKMKGFTYRGKNTVAGDTRPGNLGLANDGADFTRRLAEYPGFLLITEATAYVWNPPTEAFVEVPTLPPGVSISPNTKPTIVIAQDNCYIVGWADFNLRFDPVDRAFYRWGWEEAQLTNAPAVTAGSGDLISQAIYKYSISFQDFYTGEESKSGEQTIVTTPAGGGGFNIDVSGSVYTGNRHFNTTPGGQSSDVATVLWRTGAGDDSPRFVAILNPGQTTFTDDANAGRDTSLRPFRGLQQDEPRFSALKLFKGSFYALSKSSSSNRLYFSYFDKAPFLERWEPLGFLDLEVPEGDVLTAVGGTDATLLALSQRGTFRISTSATVTQVQRNVQRLPWHVGCVGPAARITVDGWEYFLSERGPYRWREGLTVPQEIGENLLPIFVDPVSGLCKLNEEFKELSECGFDWNTNTVRFMFPIGPDATRVNTHMAYWISADRINGDYRLGWFRQSPIMLAFDLSSSLVGVDGSGNPESPREVKERLVWADEASYVYEYRLSAKRAALGASEIAVTTVDTVPGANVVRVNDTPLFTTGDGLTGMRLEIESQPDANGDTTCEEYNIASNTSNEITIGVPAFIRTPVAGDAVRIGGIQAFWRSWFDHFGEPHQHKTMMEFSLGYQDRNNPNGTININVMAGEFPTNFVRFAQAVMSKFRTKFTVSKTAAYYAYEFSNSIPDELFLVTNFEREVSIVPARRRVVPPVTT